MIEAPAATWDVAGASLKDRITQLAKAVPDLPNYLNIRDRATAAVEFLSRANNVAEMLTARGILVDLFKTTKREYQKLKEQTTGPDRSKISLMEAARGPTEMQALRSMGDYLSKALSLAVEQIEETPEYQDSLDLYGRFAKLQGVKPDVFDQLLLVKSTQLRPTTANWDNPNQREAINVADLTLEDATFQYFFTSFMRVGGEVGRIFQVRPLMAPPDQYLARQVPERPGVNGGSPTPAEYKAGSRGKNYPLVREWVRGPILDKIRQQFVSSPTVSLQDFTRLRDAKRELLRGPNRVDRQEYRLVERAAKERATRDEAAYNFFRNEVNNFKKTPGSRDYYKPTYMRLTPYELKMALTTYSPEKLDPKKQNEIVALIIFAQYEGWLTIDLANTGSTTISQNIEIDLLVRKYHETYDRLTTKTTGQWTIKEDNPQGLMYGLHSFIYTNQDWLRRFAQVREYNLGHQKKK